MAAAAVGAAVAAGGLGTVTWAAVAPSAQIFGPTIRRTGDAGSIALTFDDGPNPVVTPELLNALDVHWARATFFAIGRHVRAFPELAAEIVARGHLIANHTETHPRLALMGLRGVTDELSRCREAIQTATVRDAKWMRPPYGFRGPNLKRVVSNLKMSGVVMWSKWAWDWKAQPAEPVIERLRGVRGGDIVLLHDGDHRVL